jgi:putative membrane-bound dehydrogenase-like protein
MHFEMARQGTSIVPRVGLTRRRVSAALSDPRRLLGHFRGVSLLALVLGIAGRTHAADPAGPPTVEQELASFRLADPALQIDLVAAEPNVVSPVAMAWDEAGRLYVAEMIDYPVGPKAGRIRRLEDHDGDGAYEQSMVFAEGLPFPNGVLPWKGGVFVTAAPDILYLRDNDGDGKADERRVVLTGFAEGNQQLRVNGLTYGLDNWIYGANGRSGGAIRRPEDPPAKAVPLDRHDFRFRPETGEVEAIAGFSQFGLPRDDWGNRFPSWNTVPVRHVVLEETVLNRNKYLASAASVASILEAPDGGRIYGLTRPRTFNKEPVTFFNASCGPTIYRGDWLPEGYRGDVFICEPLTSLVHHRKLVPSGATFVAKGVEQGREFLASTHPWFRPVNLATGPDGALYIADFCRAWVEHPQFVAADLRGSVDFHEGHDRGRIWRIRPKGKTPPGRQERLAVATLDALVSSLSSSNGWARDTAQRLLIERNDHAASFALKRALANPANRVGRVHVLWALEGLHALGQDALLVRMRSGDSRTLEHAIRLSADRLVNSSALREAVLDRVSHFDARVRFQVAIALGDLTDRDAILGLAAIANRDCGDPWTRLAVLSGLGETAWPFLLVLLDRFPDWLGATKPDQARFLSDVAAVIGAHGSDEELGGLLATLVPVADEAPKPGHLALLAGLAEGLGRTGRPLAKLVAQPPASLKDKLAGLEALRTYARKVVNSRGEGPDRRVLALGVLTHLGGKQVAEVLPELLTPDQPEPVQAAAARGLGQLGDTAAIERVLERWGTLPRGIRREVVAALVRSAVSAAPLIDALERDTVAAAEIDPAARESLRRLPDAALRQRAEQLLNDPGPTDRNKVIEGYAAALTLQADSRRGAEVFRTNCQTCHQRQGQGNRVGPDLSGIGSRPPQLLLTDILDPSREVAPDYVGFVLVTKAGQVFSGVLAEETAASLRLQIAGGGGETVLRSEIADFRPTGRSLMPEGLEQAISVQDMADLLSYLREAP